MKWIWRILYFVVIALLSIQVYGYAYFQQLEAYYTDHVEPYLNEPDPFLEGMNTLLGISYFQESPDLYAFTSNNEEAAFQVTVRTVGAVSQEQGIDGYAIVFSDLSFTKDDIPLERTIIKVTVELNDNTFSVDGTQTNRKTIIFDSGNPFSFQNVPVFYVFDFEGYNYNTETETYATIKRIEMVYGWVENDAYVFSDQLTFLATTEATNEAALLKDDTLLIDENAYRLMASFIDNTPSEDQIESYMLNTTRGDITDYNYVLNRLIYGFLAIVFVVTYFLFFHKSVLTFYKEKKNKSQTPNQDKAIFKDLPKE